MDLMKDRFSIRSQEPMHVFVVVVVVVVFNYRRSESLFRLNCGRPHESTYNRPLKSSYSSRPFISFAETWSS